MFSGVFQPPPPPKTGENRELGGGRGGNHFKINHVNGTAKQTLVIEGGERREEEGGREVDHNKLLSQIGNNQPEHAIEEGEGEIAPPAIINNVYQSHRQESFLFPPLPLLGRLFHFQLFFPPTCVRVFISQLGKAQNGRKFRRKLIKPSYSNSRNSAFPIKTCIFRKGKVRAGLIAIRSFSELVGKWLHVRPTTGE